jgi:ankyrin repeat protein
VIFWWAFRFEVVKFLLATGANVNILGGSRDSALQDCIDYGNLEIMEMLLARGANIDTKVACKNVLCVARLMGASRL